MEETVRYIIFIVLLLLLLLCIGVYCFLKYIGKYFNGYTELIKILQKVKGNSKLYMNFGLWDKHITTLTQANNNLCDFMIAKGSLDKSKTILDVGCGYGEQDLYLYSKIRKKMYCLDISPEQINCFQKNVIKHSLQKKLKAFVGNATELPFAPNSFDTVLSLESAFHYNQRTDFFKEAWRVLKPSGKLVIADIVLHKPTITFPITLCQKAFSVPTENLVTKHIWREQLEKRGFAVTLYDITEKTFVPYFMNFINNYPCDYILYSIFLQYIASWITSYIPFRYIVGIAIKQ